MNCPHCQNPVFRKSGDGTKVKARTSILVLHKAGNAQGRVEINCGICGKGVFVPLAQTPEPFELRPATLTAFRKA